MPSEIIKGVCPFGCRPVEDDRPSDFDDNGYCKHLVGFMTLLADQKPEGRLYEPLEPIQVPDIGPDNKPTGRMNHSGNMRVNGKNRQKFLPGDVLWSPLEVQRRQTVKDADERILWKPKLGISSRVYRETGETKIVQPADLERLETSAREIEDLQESLEEKKRQHAEMDLKRKAGERPAVEFADEASGEQQLKEENDPKSRKQAVSA